MARLKRIVHGGKPLPHRIVLESSEAVLEALSSEDEQSFSMSFRWTQPVKVGIRAHFEFLLEVLEERFPEIIQEAGNGV